MMEFNITNTSQFTSGAFILNGEAVNYAPYEKNSSIFLTQLSNAKLKREILKLVEECREVLKICSFIITDPEIFEAILSKAKCTNISIFVLTQLDPSKLKNQLSLLDFLTEEEVKGNSGDTHLRYIKVLFDNGVHVRATVSAHAKFIIADRERGFITSANLTTPSLTLNTESGVYLTQKDSVDLDKLFDVVFQLGSTYRQFLSSSRKNKMFVVQSDVTIRKELLPDATKSNLRYTYEIQSQNLYREIISIINGANEYLYISTYSIVGLASLTELTDALGKAINRGVTVNLFCRGMNYRNDHLTGCHLLSSAGCSIFGDVYNHSKGIINENTGMIFTANLDGFHGLKNGFEVGYVLEENQRLDFLDVHKELIRSACYRYVQTPSRESLFRTYDTYERLKEMIAPVFPPSVNIVVGKHLAVHQPEITELPLFYAKSKQGECLIAGNLYFKCMVDNNTFTLLEKVHAVFDIERYILKYENLKIFFQS